MSFTKENASAVSKTPLPEADDASPSTKGSASPDCLSRTYCSALVCGDLWTLWREDPLKQGVPSKVKTKVHWGKVSCRGQWVFSPFPASADHVGCSELHWAGSPMSPYGNGINPTGEGSYCSLQIVLSVHGEIVRLSQCTFRKTASWTRCLESSHLTHQGLTVPWLPLHLNKWYTPNQQVESGKLGEASRRLAL